MAHNSGRVCSYYLQGNCRFGDRCWYEHPRGGRASQAFGENSGSNRKGVQGGQHHSVSFQASNYSKSSKWKSNKDPRSSNFSQNRFAALDSSEHVNKDIQPDEELHEIIMKDMEIWESSGQWMFSSYSPMKEKPNISGFSDFLPEELRLVYYNCKANNNTQAYVNSVQQLATQWKGRLSELKNATPSTKTAMATELKNVTNHQSPPFGFRREHTPPPRTSNFPTDTRNTVQAFSFKSSEPAAVSSGNLPNVQGAVLSSVTPPTVGFNNVPDSSAGSFSFNTATTSDGIGTSGFSAIFSPDTAPATAFGKAIVPPAFSSTYTHFGESAPSLTSNIAVTSPAIPSFGSTEELFTFRLQLSTEELKQFGAKKFTLGKVPLRPPPVEFLNM
ncbi:nucleoporin NUP42 [Vipera latastei]